MCPVWADKGQRGKKNIYIEIYHLPAHPTLTSCLGMRPSQVTDLVLSSLFSHPSSRHKKQDFLSGTSCSATLGPLPSLHVLLRLFRGLAVTVCFLLQLFWFLSLLSAQTCCFLSSKRGGRHKLVSFLQWFHRNWG